MRGAWALLLVPFFAASKGWAYPDFISYGYTSCLTCHTNSLGNGPLTPYGRSLFAVEIAARPFIPKSVSDERLAEMSSFIPGRASPYWLQPSLKYRGLKLVTSPNGAKETRRWYNMQRDFSLVMAATDAQRTLSSATYSLLPERQDYYRNGKQIEAVSKEHYLRFFASENLLIAIGLMDKAYGIRTADHTAYSRRNLGMSKDDQVHGVLFHYVGEKWETAVHAFAGNLMRPKADRQKGFSLLSEFDVADRNRLGFSLAAFQTESQGLQRIALHDRWGFPNAKGSSIWFELGFKNDKDLSTGIVRAGSYGIAQINMRLIRGYNFYSAIERVQDINSLKEPDKRRWTLGFLIFPFQRLEGRLSLSEESVIASKVASEDAWSWQGQVHASF